MDLEGDGERRYIFFEAKNRSQKENESAPADAPAPAVKVAGTNGRKGRLPVVQPPKVKVEEGRRCHPAHGRGAAGGKPLVVGMAPGSPLSPGGRDGAAR